jgi:NTE family protein
MTSDRTVGGGRRGVTLVLGGGGARGLAHLGVIQVLEQAGVSIRAVVGASAGAIMGAAWLQRRDAGATIADLLAFLRSSAFARLGLAHAAGPDRTRRHRSMLSRLLTGWRRQVAMQLLFRRESLFHRRRLERLVSAAVDDGSLESLRLPLLVAAFDLKSGEEVVLDHGRLREALTASASVAGFFPPVVVDGRRLVDAGLADTLPVAVAVARFGRPVVAVDLSRDVDTAVEPRSAFEILLRTEELASRFNSRQRAMLADVEVAPRLGGRWWLDFSAPETIVAAGAAAAKERLDEVVRLAASA